MNERPEDKDLIAIYATLFQRDDNFALALILWKKVLQLDKKPPAALYNNLGLCAVALGTKDQQEQGERYLRKALELEPDSIPALNNSALVALHSGDYQRCLALCNRSIEIQAGEEQHETGIRDAHETRAYANLILGNWEQGWKDWDWSLGSKYRPHIGDEPYWRGEKGMSLLLRGEQGIGDEISFASVLPDAAKDNRITLECDYRLEGLFRRSFPDVQVYGTRRGEKRGNFVPHDRRALIGSLCRHYRNSAESFPGTPYLKADPERRLQWRALLDTFPGKKIGIAWTGGKLNSFSERRSFELEQWVQILRKPHTFISLQYKNPDAEIEAFSKKHGIEIKHWPRASESNDYDDTAALVSELDLVISATTAVVHLCGALGKECWVLAPQKPRWFYGRKGRSIPWYQSVEVFRQEKEWPIGEIASRL